MHMDLRDIEYFAVIAEHGHLGRAAEALGLGQPALSISLRRLEREADAKLVRRTPKGVELTAVGSALLSHVRRLQLARGDLARELADLAHGRAGHLRIGAGPTITENLLAVTCTALLGESPKVSFKITVSDNDVMIPALRNGEFDLVVNYLGMDPLEDLVKEQLYEDGHGVIASASHPLAKKKQVTLADLAQQKWALNEQTLLSQQWLRRKFQESGYPPPRCAFESRSIRLRLQAVASSDLLDYTSRQVYLQAAERFRLVELPVEQLKWRRPVGVVYREGGYLSPAARRFIELLKETSERIATGER
jgi:DNA-binding transcriptional LysR family regulator